ncbi:MAG: helix-turn-helix domain-containing protein [Acidobacteriota bacterium]
MNRESGQYRFARLEAYHTTLARLEEKFRDRAVNLGEMKEAVAEQLRKEWLCAPWRKSETELAGCREGMRIAGLQFLSHARQDGPLTAALHADQVRKLFRGGSSKSQIARRLHIGRTPVRRTLAAPPRKK